MNVLWEQFLYVTLRTLKTSEITISAQTPRKFWQPEQGRHARLKPDIWIQHKDGNIILDTKWKNLNGKNPSPEDLRQMYVYHEYFGAKKVALVYPGERQGETNGLFWRPDNQGLSDKACSVLLIPVWTATTSDKKWIKQWQEDIRARFRPWVEG